MIREDKFKTVVHEDKLITFQRVFIHPFWGWEIIKIEDIDATLDYTP